LDSDVNDLEKEAIQKRKNTVKNASFLSFFTANTSFFNIFAEQFSKNDE